MSDTWGLRIQQKHDTEVNWNEAATFIPRDGEIVVYDAEQSSDARPSNRNFPYKGPRMKVGDGQTSVTDLLFVNEEISKIYANRYAYETYYNMLKQLTEIEDMPDICVIPEGSKTVTVNLLPEAKLYVFPWGVEYIQGTFRDTVEYVAFPNTLQSLPNSVFAFCNKLKRVTIPDSVTSIGSNAFRDCSSLTSIVIPDSVTSIGGYAFYKCSALTSIEIPDSVTEIMDYTFDDCNALMSVVIADSVTTIGSGVFRGCSSLTSIDIPDGVPSIGYATFQNCISLTSVVIPDSVTSIGSQAFNGCNNLTDVSYTGTETQWDDILIENGNSKLDDATKHYSTKDLKFSGFTFSVDGSNTFYTLTKYTGTRTDVCIPSTYNGLPVKSIGNEAFKGYSSLTSIEIPDSVSTIGYGAFSGCSSLTSVTIGNGVTSIGSYAFYNCSSLTSVIIPDSVTTMGECAFQYCSSLVSITIPFVGATKGGTENTDLGYIFSAVGPGYNHQYVPSSLKTVVITEGPIGNRAFYNCKTLENIIIPDSVNSIGEGAFYNCSSLTSIDIPDSVNSIGKSAFYYCTSLTSITIPDSVTSIGRGALGACTALLSLKIPFTGLTESNISSSSAAFGDTLFGVIFGTSSGTGLTKNTQFWIYANERNEKIFYIPTNLKHVTVTKKMQAFAFAGSLIERVTLSPGITTLIHNAFQECSKLRYVDLPTTITDVGSNAFLDCPALVKSRFDNAYYIGTADNPFFILLGTVNKTITSCIIHPETRILHDKCFYNHASLANIAIPKNVYRILAYAFSRCTGLTKLTIDSTNLKYIGEYAFCGCTSLSQALVLPDGLLEIGSRAFKDCTKLQDPLTLPNSLTTIGNAAFFNASVPAQLGGTPTDMFDQGVTLMPASIKSIGKNAFALNTNRTVTYENTSKENAIPRFNNALMWCWGIQNIPGWFNIKISNSIAMGEGLVATQNAIWSDQEIILTPDIIPPGIKKIPAYVLAGAKSLSNIIVPRGVTSIEAGAFLGSSITIIYIPKTMITIASDAFSSSQLTTIKYEGSQTEWEKVSKGTLTGVTVQCDTTYPI